MKNIAIVPARGGSKRIKRKNIRSFCGKPMLQHTIDHLFKSQLFEKVLISSDDEEIIEFTEKMGADVLFKRPDNLSDDLTPTVPVIQHAISEAEKHGWEFENVCCVYACNPFLEIADLQYCLELIQHSAEEIYAFPICAFPSPIQRALRIDKTNKVKPFSSENTLTRTQDLETSYFDAGQFYWGKKSTWFSQAPIHEHAFGVEVPSWRVVDFDTYDDWERGELMFRAKQALEANE